MIAMAGTGALIRALQEQLPTEKILLGREVLKIEEKVQRGSH